MMVCAELGVEDCDFTNGAAYVAHWVSKLRNDKREIFHAAADAQRIADYLLAFHPDFANGASPANTASSRSPERDEDEGLKAAA